jgi:hypothetical protein
MLGALVGGWLRFNATEGIFAVLTTVAGAVAGSNLALIVFDVAGERSARRAGCRIVAGHPGDGLMQDRARAAGRPSPTARQLTGE